MAEHYIELTDQEFATVTKVLSERVKNLAYVRAEQWVRSQLRALLRREDESGLWSYPNQNDKITLTYSVDFVMGDVAEIVGGLRRAEAQLE